MTKSVKVFFTMVKHPFRGWIRVGNAYSSKEAAQEWLPFVSKAWSGLKAKVSPCTLKFVNGKLSNASLHTLDVKFNMNPPDQNNEASGERVSLKYQQKEMPFENPA